jgi:hypothetical protein
MTLKKIEKSVKKKVRHCLTFQVIKMNLFYFFIIAFSVDSLIETG